MANMEAALRYHEHWKRAAEIKVEHQECKFRPLEVKALASIFPDGLRRGTIAEIAGARSTGRTSLACHILGQSTGRGEVCATVDLHNSFSPELAAQAGVQLERMVWVRCGGNAEAALRATDLLLHAGGFGIVHLDLCEGDPRQLNRIPLSSWYRFRRVLENTSTVLLVCTDSSQAKSFAWRCLEAKSQVISWLGNHSFPVLGGLTTDAVSGKLAPIRPQSLFWRVAG